MIRLAALLLALAPGAAPAAPQEVARAYILSKEAILFEDGTWAFADGTALLSAPAVDVCMTSADGRLSFCPDAAHWSARQIVTSEGVEDHFLTSVDPRFSLTASQDHTYGHEGDIAYYTESVGGGGGLLERLLYRAAQLPMPEEQLLVHDDMVIIVSDVIEDAQYYYHTVEIIQPDQSFYFEINVDSVGSGTQGFDSLDALRTEAAVHRERLATAIRIDDTPLIALAGKAPE